MIRIAAFLTMIGIVSLGTVSTGQAVDLGRYQDGPAFGAWQVLCDEEADMGGTTYFDCVVRSAGAPAIVVANLEQSPTVVPVGSQLADRLILNDRVIDFADCPGSGCPLAESAGAAVALLTDPPATVEATGQRTELSAEGLAEAIDLALRRLD